MKEISRRQFIKIFGGATVASSTLLTACKNKDQSAGAVKEPPKDKMTYRVNPNTNEKVSLLGYGMMRLPKESDKEDAPYDQDMINRQVDYAIEHGVNYFDTCPAYCMGQSETCTGIALHRHPRDKYFVATKMSNFSPETWSKKASMEMFENSLKALQVEWIDYLLLHAIGGDSRDMDSEETFNARFMDNGILDWLVEQKKKGRIHNLGFSYHGDIRAFDYLLSLQDQGLYHWDHVLIQHNYVDWNHAKLINPSNTNSSYLYAELEKRNIPSFIMEPLLGGQLANLNDHAVQLLKQRDPQSSIASWAFRFAGQQPRVLTVLSGMTYLEHLQDNIRTYSPHKPLNDDELKMLEEIADIFANFKTIPCTDCRYCMPCPYGINIPGVFAHYNKCLNEGNVMNNNDDAGDDARKAFRKARRAFLVDYGRSVPSFRQADHCIGCGHCLAECPQGINIPEQMVRINDYVEQLKQSQS